MGGDDMPLAEKLTICECWARDGLQSMPSVVPTAAKIEMINRSMAAGAGKVEVTSFSHPRLLPQFADCVEVLRGIERRPDVSTVVLIPNAKGFDRFAECVDAGCGADEIILMISSSEAHNLVNFGLSHDDARRMHAGIMDRAHRLGVRQAQ